MKRSPKQEAARWLRQANEDFKTADYLIKGEKYYFAVFAFQQASEKALKAYLYYQGLRFVTGHSVMALCKQCAKSDDDFATMSQDVNGLDLYYITARYPNGLPDGIPAEAFSLSDAQRTRGMCQKVIRLVKAKIRI